MVSKLLFLLFFRGSYLEAPDGVFWEKTVYFGGEVMPRSPNREGIDFEPYYYLLLTHGFVGNNILI